MRFKWLCLTLVFALGLMVVSGLPALAGHPIGDANDDAVINVGDVVYLVTYLYKGGPEPIPVVDAGDVNHDCVVNVGDIVYLVTYLYKGGPAPCGGTGMIYGYVTYAHLEGAVDGATITIQETAQSATSADECVGYYILKGADPGTYNLDCTDTDDPNSATVTQNGVIVVAGEMTRVDFELYPTTTITVTGPRPAGLGTQQWTRGCHKYVMSGECSVTSGQELTIDAGVTVYGSVGQPTTYLAVQQGGKIIADGEACLPIVFTSNAGTGSREGGDWGGLMLFGYSPMNTGCGTAEGDAGDFGCDCPPGGDPPCNEEDSSGVLRYVRVEFAGVELGPDNELNGIAMYGVGSRTLIDYVQVHRNYDDGIEWFGGTNNAKHVLVSECWDDHFDWTDGARFTAQFVALRGYGGYFDGVNYQGKWGDRMMECDNQENNYNLQPGSNPLILNVTIVGGKEVRYSGSGAPVSNSENMKLRHGTGGRIYNVICMDATSAGLDCQHDNEHAWIEDYGDAPWPDGTINADSLDVDYAIFFNNDYDSDPLKDGIGHWKDRSSEWTTQPSVVNFDAVCLADPYLPHTGDAWSAAGLYPNPPYSVTDPGIEQILADNGTGNYDPLLIAPREVTEVTGSNPDFRPLAGSPALQAGNYMPLAHALYAANPFLDPVEYVGGFDVGNPANHDNDWTYPWAAWPDN